jgi:predicted Rossmann fold nucleotide-binding protein DprA/Smf involved in DNA uptake
MNREHRNRLLQGQLALISPYDPSARFQVGHAMQRNKVAYGLADAALVVNADLNKRGTWAGATEQLDKLHLVRVYIRSTGEPGEGLEGLRKKGAFPWPNPEGPVEFDAALFAGSAHSQQAPAQAEISFAGQQHIARHDRVRESPPLYAASAHETAQSAADPALDPADELFGTVRVLVLGMLREPRNVTDVASGLRITKPQAEEWLRRLVQEGVIEKRTRPVSYVIRQVDLFGGTSSKEADASDGRSESRESPA